MATKNIEAEYRSKIAEACIEFASHLLKIRVSSVTPSETLEIATTLFQWFEDHNAFTKGNVGIALKAISYGGDLLASRKTATIHEAVESIQALFENLST